MYEEDYMTWFANDADNFVNHYYEELYPQNVKDFLAWLDKFFYYTSEDYFNFHYEQIMQVSYDKWESERLARLEYGVDL
jgi:hypothetical protein